MVRHTLQGLTLVTLAVCLTGGAVFHAKPPRVVIISLDGAGACFIDRLIERGQMPFLANIAQRGGRASYARTNFTSKTAAGHAALWTGAFGPINGITANRVPLLPRAAHTILEHQSGFAGDALLAEPLFVSAARAGKRVLAVNATHTTPLPLFKEGGRFGAGLHDRLRIATGFAGETHHGGVLAGNRPLPAAQNWLGHLPPSDLPVLETPVTPEDAKWWGLISADPANPRAGYDTMSIYAARDTHQRLARLNLLSGTDPVGFSSPLRLPNGQNTCLALTKLTPDGQTWQVMYSPGTRTVFSQAALGTALEAEQADCIPGGASVPYRRGKLGPTVIEGGDGEAERLYTASVRLAIQQAARGIRALTTRQDWDLCITYLPFPDEVEHLWYGYVTQGSPAYRTHLENRLMPHVDTVSRAIDQFLQMTRDACGADTNLMVVSDHGMAPARWDFYPNAVLREAGLLVLQADGQVDLSRTRAMYSLCDGGYVIVNSRAFKGGIVPVGEVPAVARLATAALQKVQIRTGVGPRTLVKPSILLPGEAQMTGLGVGGELCGDLYLDLPPGFNLDPDVLAPSPFKIRPPHASGCHIFDARREDLHAIFFAHGPAFKTGFTLGGICNTDVAPTASAILRIPCPAQATGRVLVDALDLTGPEPVRGAAANLPSPIH